MERANSYGFSKAIPYDARTSGHGSALRCRCRACPGHHRLSHGPIRTLSEARDAARAQRHSGITGPISPLRFALERIFFPRHWSLARRTAIPSGRQLTASTLSLAAAGSSPAGSGPPVRPGRRTLQALTSTNYLSTAGALLAHEPRRMASSASREAAPPTNLFSYIFTVTTSNRSGSTNQTWNS